MAAYWTNFAKRGDPNGEGLRAWPAFSDTNPVVMHLGPTARTGAVPTAAGLKVLDEYFAWRRTPAGVACCDGPEGAGPRKPRIWGIDDSGDTLVLKERYGS